MEKVYKKLAVAFTGVSNSGKTTLVIKVSNTLQKLGFKVAIVKNDPKDKARFDTEGKDSYKFFSTGADVAVVSPKKTTMFKQTNSNIDEIIDMFGDFDYLLVEGLKNLPLPRICVVRDNLDLDYLDISDTIATNDSIDKSVFPKEMEILNLDNLKEIINWIDKNGKRV